jgi:hypothetical protein
MQKALFILSIILIAFTANAQTNTQEADSTSAPLRSISSHLRINGARIHQDARLETLVTSFPKIYYGNPKAGSDKNVYYTKGYRVRVFSGNNQTQSKNLAYQIEKELIEKMPDLDTYVVFKTPNWRLLVGNYRTSEEAYRSLKTLKKEFPARGREMFVIQDEIEIPIE